MLVGQLRRALWSELFPSSNGGRSYKSLFSKNPISPLENHTLLRFPLLISVHNFHWPTTDVFEQRFSIICPFFFSIALPFSSIVLFSSFSPSFRFIFFDLMISSRMLELWKTGSKLTGNDRNSSSFSLIVWVPFLFLFFVSAPIVWFLIWDFAVYFYIRGSLNRSKNHRT